MSKTTCSGDPLPCIEWLLHAIADVLKDGRTMAVLALALVVLWKIRQRQRREAAEAYLPIAGGNAAANRYGKSARKTPLPNRISVLGGHPGRPAIERHADGQARRPEKKDAAAPRTP